MSKTPQPTRVWTSTQMAADLGINRSTLVRLEQRLVIPKAPVVGHPIAGRVYDEPLANRVRAAFQKYNARRAADAIERPKAPKDFVIVDRL